MTGSSISRWPETTGRRLPDVEPGPQPSRARVAIVVSPREWEQRLVDAIQTSGQARLVARVYDPDDVVDRLDEIDVVVVGAETPWLSAWLLGAWRRLGLRVVGVHDERDSPARRLLSGADDMLVEHLDPLDMMRAIRATM